MSMTLFLITAVFVAYIVYVMYQEDSTSGQQTKAKEPSKRSSTAATSSTASTRSTASSAPAKKANVAPKQTPKKTATATSTGNSEEVKSLKNPATGEVATVPANYRFAKRWIKEAIVEEGLLDRVYNNNDLKVKSNEDKVKKAIEQIKSIKKYHP